MTENVRMIALETLLEIQKDGAYSHLVLSQVLEKYSFLPKRDRAFLSRLVEGTLERQIELDYIINAFSRVPAAKQKPVIREILRSGVYQLKYMEHVPDSAVCNEAVRLAEKKGFHGLKGFVNGVLRSISRGWRILDYPDRSKNPALAFSVAYSVPEWIIQMWLAEYDEATVEQMLEAFLKEEPLTVRCQLSRLLSQPLGATNEQRAAAIEECRQGLEKQGVQVAKHPYLDTAFRISGYDRLEGLTLFQEGYLAVQDVSSMLVSCIAAPKPGDFVLDVCAAPGGKSLHMADLLAGNGRVCARDLSMRRTERILENVHRLRSDNVTVQVQDACVLDDTMTEQADVVLVDAPCSGLGVLGKKKDIKYRIQKKDLEELVSLQRSILDVVWRYVKPGGVLIYSTCTVHKAENEENVRWFTDNYPFQCESIRPFLCEELAAEPTAEQGYLQLLPGRHKTDGFFMARLVRI